MTLPSIDVAPPQTTTDIELVVASDEELARPYRVIIENDDVTPMDFVILILLSVFPAALFAWRTRANLRPRPPLPTNTP